MSSPYRTLDREELSRDLLAGTFGQPPHRSERFGLEVELIPVRWSPTGERSDPVPIVSSPGGEIPGSVKTVREFARELGLGLTVPDGSPVQPPADDSRGSFSFEPGGQIEYSSAAGPSPAAAYGELARVLDGLNAALRGFDVEAVCIGCNPWHGVDRIGLQASAPRYVCMDSTFASVGEFGPRMMRQTATVHVNIDLGSPVRAPLRWQAAQLLAPVALATFANSPLIEGRSAGFRSFRGRIWNLVEPTRCGFPRGFTSRPDGPPHEQYLDFALGARLLLLRRPKGWIPMPRPVSFETWMEHGLDGEFPTLDDWHYHLTTLFPEVRPKGFLELRSADGQGRAFWPVPLTWGTALLCDDSALARVIERLLPGAGRLQERWETAARDGLGDPELAEDARFLFGTAADALLRFPDGFLSDEMRRAFVVFGERFTLAGRSPADDVLDAFLDGPLDRARWNGLQDEWCEAAGTRVTAG